MLWISAAALWTQLVVNASSTTDFAHLYQPPQSDLAPIPDLTKRRSKKLQDEFARSTGKIVPAMVVSAAMVTRRKAGKLTTLKPKSSEATLGFQDIDQVVG